MVGRNISSRRITGPRVALIGSPSRRMDLTRGAPGSPEREAGAEGAGSPACAVRAQVVNRTGQGRPPPANVESGGSN